MPSPSVPAHRVLSGQKERIVMLYYFAYIVVWYAFGIFSIVLKYNKLHCLQVQFTQTTEKYYPVIPEIVFAYCSYKIIW